MILRRATPADADRLLTWRNDPASIAASLSPGPVSAKAHLRWLSWVLVAPSVAIYIAEEAGAPVGTCRIQDGEYSWTVAPGARGCGVGKKMVALLVAAHPGGRCQVRAENVASLKIATALGIQTRVV